MHRLDSDELRLGKNFIEGSDYRRRRKTDRLIWHLFVKTHSKIEERSTLSSR